MTKSFRLFLGLLVLYGIVWFVALGYRDLVDPDEGRYAEIPREMVVSGNYLTPRLVGLKYFEKPPFQYWMTAATFEVFGMSNATARLWLAVIGFIGALWTAIVAARLYGRETGYYAFVITASAVLYCGAAHFTTLDMTVSVFIFMGVSCLLVAQSRRDDPRQVRNWMLAGYAVLAAAVLTKGLIGVVLPAAAVFFYSIWQRDWDIWKHLHLVKGTLLLLALTAPWFIMVSHANDEFARFFFIHEHVERYLTPVAQHEGPPWYFLVILGFGMLPWTSTVIAGLAKPGFSWRWDSDGSFNAERFLWVYAMFILLFFSAGHSKLPAYILPAFPALAMLAARHMAKARRWHFDGWLMLAFGLVMFTVGLFMERLASDKIPVALYRDYQPFIIASGIVLMLGSLALLKGKREPRVAVAVAGLFAILGTQFALWGFHALTPSRSGAEIARTINELKLPPSAPVYMIDNYSPSMPFYLDRMVTMVKYTGELKLGESAEPDKWIADPAEFARRWRADKQAVAVFRNDNIEHYRSAFDLPGTIIKHGPRRTVMIRRQPVGMEAK